MATSSEFRKTSNGPLSRKTAYQLQNALLGGQISAQRQSGAKSAMAAKKQTQPHTTQKGATKINSALTMGESGRMSANLAP